MDASLDALPEVIELGRVSGWLARKGWSEAGSGNLSLRFDSPSVRLDGLPAGPPIDLPLVVPRLSGCHLLLTARGSRARELEAQVEPGAGVFRVLAGGRQVACLWGNPQASSEWAAHLAIHQMLIDLRPAERGVLHTHPADLIALTHLPELQDSRALSRTLLAMQSEAHVLFPEGLRYVPYSTAGTISLAEQTAQALEGARVAFWHLHGVVATGETLTGALDSIEYLDKMAQVYWRLRSCGASVDGMSDEQVERALRHFGLWDRHQGVAALEPKRGS
jgi:rhamnulose-1-phosphate aldolase